MHILDLCNFVLTAGTTTIDLSTVITADMLTGVFDQLVKMLPVVLPASFGLLGVRKAIGFVIGMIKGA